MGGDVLLLGGGHAHLGIAAHAMAFRARGCRLTVVSDGPTWYSGMATGVLGGVYPIDGNRIDTAAFVARSGGEFVLGRIARVDATGRRVHLADGRTLAYDVASLDLGSEVHPAIPGGERAVAVKPLECLAGLRSAIAALPRGPAPVRLIVIGGGASGCEVALNAVAAIEATGARVDASLVAADGVLPRAPSRARDLMWRVLSARSIAVRESRVERIADGRVVLADGDRLAAGLIVLATGLRPSSVVRASGLPTDAEGALVVDDRLRAVGVADLFGGGDCVAVQGRRLERIGVHAVRQAEVLRHNLLATVTGRPLVRYRPQSRCLQILNLGDRTGLAIWGGWAARGRWAWWLKDRIDRRWMARFR